MGRVWLGQHHRPGRLRPGQVWPWLIGAWLLLLATGCDKRPAAGPAVAPVAASEYLPGRYLTWERYESLSEKFNEAWVNAREPDVRLAELLTAMEPEAIHALDRLLTDPKTTTMYATFTREPFLPLNAETFNFSFDGLLGFRVLRQLEVPMPDGSQRLISALSTYRYDRQHRKFLHRIGPDSIRLRVEIAPWHRSDVHGAVGIVGFSWATYAAANELEVGQVKAIPYVNADSSFRYKDVTACGFADHCNLCHHDERRNVFDKMLAENRSAEKMPGYRSFLSYLEGDVGVAGGELELIKSLLGKPRETFAAPDLQSAVKARLSSLEH
jgi:hypothetical protein